MRRVLLVLLSGVFWILTVSPVFAQQEDTYNRGLYYYIKGDYRQAERLFREYLKKRPDPSAYYLTGYALYKQRRFSQALDFFRQAYLIDPEFSPKGIDYTRAHR